MSYPGVKQPEGRVEKDGQLTAEKQSPGSKHVECELRDFTAGAVPDIFDAPTSRVYTRDYSKAGRESDDTDLVSPALGKPVLRI